jgi:sigma-54 dependent transcriptional regulator, acetoin dehydrogenase operon transcriptional activator AcoR
MASLRAHTPHARGTSVVPGPGGLRDLRDRFIADPQGTDLSGLRPVIARSWMRSLRSGVDPELSAPADTRCPQLEDRVIESAEPAMRKVLETLSDTRGCIGLADSRGTVAALRGTVDALAWAEPIFGAGASMSEDVIGTSCVGTALEEGDGLRVWGAEHFATDLQDTVCLSSLVRDPLRGSVRAVLVLVLPLPPRLDDVRGLGGLLDGAAREIANVLAVRAAPREHALLMAYLRELRKRGAGAVVAIDGRTTLASQDALELLGAQDYPVLSAYAQESVRAQSRMTKDIVLANDRVATVCVEPVLAGRERVGSVLQVRVDDGAVADPRQPRDTEGDPFQAFVGDSRALRHALDLSATSTRRSLPVHVVGEPGTGKRMLAIAIAATRAEETVCVDLGGVDQPEPEHLERVAGALDAGAAVVLAGVDAVHPDGWQAIARLLDGRAPDRVLFTARRLPDQAVAALARLGSLEIVMPGLDARREDIPALVVQCLASTPTGPCRVSQRLMRLFTEATFVRNVTELRDIVGRAAVRCTRAELTTDDLADEDRRSLMRIALSPLQTAEAEQIREALRRADGNRVRAAAMLKIGRSTLYRRLDAYARLGFDLEAEVPGSSPASIAPAAA